MDWIDLDNAANVRDLGELPTTSGERTRIGRLIRADNLQDLSPADVHHLVDDLGVSGGCAPSCSADSSLG